MRNLAKIILVLVLCVGSANAAEKAFLQCSTPGDALGAVDVLIREDGVAVVRVSALDDSPAVDFIIASGLEDLKLGTSTTIIAQEKDGISFGGGRSKAALLRVFSGQKSARFAAGGYVYNLQCNLRQ